MWLRDLLPAALPNVRIMTFGYNAHFKNFTAQQDLRSIASKLLAELVDLRTTEEVCSLPLLESSAASFIADTVYSKDPAGLSSFVIA